MHYQWDSSWGCAYTSPESPGVGGQLSLAHVFVLSTVLNASVISAFCVHAILAVVPV